MNGSLIELKSVSKSYVMPGETVLALSNISLDIKQGELIAVTGPSGSGKSTLLQLIGGLDKPSKGEIIIDGSPIHKYNDKQLSHYRNQIIGFVFQSYYLQPYLNVLENITIPLLFTHKSAEYRQKQAKKYLDAVGLADRLQHYPNQLSGGQMQRVAIARALVNEPLIILADEPTANLDKTNTQSVIELLQKINKEFGTTIIIVTHNEKVAQATNRIINLESGDLV